MPELDIELAVKALKKLILIDREWDSKNSWNLPLHQAYNDCN